MKHAIAGNRLGRNQTLRKATIRDLAKATLTHQRILTTKAKAKEARKLIDKLITMGKKGTLAHKRMAFAVLCNHGLVSDLFEKIAKRFMSRPGGYTRIIPLSVRRGDHAQLVFLELTEKDTLVVSKPKSDAVGKAQDKEKEPGKKKQPEKVKAEVEEKKSKILKSESTRHDTPGAQGKSKSKPKIMGGIKQMFTKKPSGD